MNTPRIGQKRIIVDGNGNYKLQEFVTTCEWKTKILGDSKEAILERINYQINDQLVTAVVEEDLCL